MNTGNPLLTQSERDVLIQGALHPRGEHISNSEIGKRLDIPVTKVKTLIHQACVKLDAHSRNEAIFLAMRRGEICLDELLTLEELAEILSSLDPEMVREIAHLVRRETEAGRLSGADQQLIPTGGKRGGRLTNREKDVLILVSRGLTNPEIAARLCMSTSAVRTFLNRASTKLGARRRADVVRLALKQKELCVGEISSLGELLGFLAPLGADSIETLASLLDRRAEKDGGRKGGSDLGNVPRELISHGLLGSLKPLVLSTRALLHKSLFSSTSGILRKRSGDTPSQE